MSNGYTTKGIDSFIKEKTFQRLTIGKMDCRVAYAPRNDETPGKPSLRGSERAEAVQGNIHFFYSCDLPRTRVRLREDGDDKEERRRR